MLNVPPQAFPAPGSQQRVSAGGRAKVPLKPGRSLMDWIRLTKSGKDLTGLKGRLIEVTEDELAKHNKKEDCWICIRGFVYNVTPYMEYHPGGEDELMKAAGTDGTDLFDQVHRWVNYESMLKECLVGRMAVKPVAAPKEISSTLSEEKKQLNGMLPEKKGLGASVKDLTPSYDWFQTDSLITIVIYTKQKDMNAELVIVDCQDKRLRGEIIVGDHSYLVEVDLDHAVQEDTAVNISEKVGKVEIVLKKKDNVHWKMLGQPLESHNTFIKRTDRGMLLLKAAQEFSLKGFSLEVFFGFAFVCWFVLSRGGIGVPPGFWKDCKNLIGEGEDCLSIIPCHGYLCASYLLRPCENLSRP